MPASTSSPCTPGSIFSSPPTANTPWRSSAARRATMARAAQHRSTGPRTLAERSRKPKKKWTKELGWTHIHTGDWEFPMNPKRFTESACIKCHYQVTDLISADNKNEAPQTSRLQSHSGKRLLRLPRDRRPQGGPRCRPRYAAGIDAALGRSAPRRNEASASKADLDNRPGNLRKVGPSLYRLSEKTNEEFTRKWIRAPREFRPDTKMPHFYGTSNNSRRES